MALSHTVFECQSDKCKGCRQFYPIFAQNRLPWQRSLRGPDRSSTPRKLSFDVKIAKIGSADIEIICLREIIKKIFKKKKLEMRGKA